MKNNHKPNDKYNLSRSHGINGLIVPVTTPFNDDFSICQSAYTEHLSWLSCKGVKKIIIGGTTAEFFSLTTEERMGLLSLGRKHFPSLIIFNISAGCVLETIQMAERACNEGADALICLPPYYYAGAPQSGLIKYFNAVSATCRQPFFLYNFPKHTGNPITKDILLNVPHAGLKDSGQDLSLISDTPNYFLGGDSLIVEAYRKGGCGYVPGLPNVFPEIYLELEKLLGNKEFDKADILQSRINSFKKSLPKVSGIVIVKKYLNSVLKSYPATVRPPLDDKLYEPINLSILL